jgi:hypothetical protein
MRGSSPEKNGLSYENGEIKPESKDEVTKLITDINAFFEAK